MEILRFGIHIKCKDILKSYSFYKTFGLKPVFSYGSKDWISIVTKDYPGTQTADENYEGVIFNIGNSTLEIANGHISVKQEVFSKDITSSKVSAMINVDSINKILKVCETNNIEVVVPIKIYPWGTKELVIKDPDGFVLVFIENIRE